MTLLSLLLLAAVPDCPAVGPGSPGLPQLGWLAGAWSGDDRGTLNEEVWLAPSGGLMLAMHRDTAGGRATGFEFLRIEQDGARLVYRAMPQGRPATDFPRVAQGPSCIVFENPEHAFPRRILYWREGASLHARIEGTRQGKAASHEWVWTAAPRRSGRTEGGARELHPRARGGREGRLEPPPGHAADGAGRVRDAGVDTAQRRRGPAGPVVLLPCR